MRTTTRRRLLGVVLRMLGPAIEILCVVALLRYRGQGRLVLGVRLESLLMAGFVLGLVCVFLGLWLSFAATRSRPDRFDLDLGSEAEAEISPRIN